MDTDTYTQGHHPSDRESLKRTIARYAPERENLLSGNYRQVFRQAWDTAKAQGEKEYRLAGIARREANTWLRGELGIVSMINKDERDRPI